MVAQQGENASHPLSFDAVQRGHAYSLEEGGSSGYSIFAVEGRNGWRYE